MDMFVGTAVGRPATPSVKLERSGLTGRVSRAASSNSLCIFACRFLQHNEETHVSIMGYMQCIALPFDEVASKQLKASNHNVATFSCDFLTPYASKKLLHTSRFHCFQIRLAAILSALRCDFFNFYSNVSVMYAYH